MILIQNQTTAGLATIDWILIAIFGLITLFIGLRFSKMAGKDLSSFFLSGRQLPWYIAGVSMVATTFAADTPLAVTELVAENGIAGNWLWWNMLIGGMLTTFFFARLWRRADILTEVEFINIRYGGRAARWLRSFKSVYLGLIMNVLIMGWVHLAFISILEVFFGIPSSTAIWYVLIATIIIASYAALSGLWGVAINDSIQFVIAMTGSIMLAYFVIDSPEVGGIEGLKAKLPDARFSFFPEIGNNAADTASVFTLGIGSFLAYLGVQWWASWYPGAEPGGGGYIAQRMMSAKDEKNALFASLFFQIAHYCVRPWPWILVALSALVLYPDLGADDKKLGYVMAMNDYLPAGWKGLMLVAFVSAYMSTISTQLNWGASYLVNDVFEPMKKKSDSLQNISSVTLSRIITIALALISVAVCSQLNSISAVWKFILECGAGLGLVLILRWYWWRINVWSEITATLAPFLFYALGNFVLNLSFPNSFFLTVGATTISWISITFLTRAEKNEILIPFYSKVRPPGIWGPIKEQTGIESKDGNIGWLLLAWLSAIVMTYCLLFSLGKLIFMEYQLSLNYAIISLAGFLGLMMASKKTNVLA